MQQTIQEVICKHKWDTERVPDGDLFLRCGYCRILHRKTDPEPRIVIGIVEEVVQEIGGTS